MVMVKMESITIEAPIGMAKYMTPKNSKTELIRNALLLYPHILNQTLSHGRAAEILGIRKYELIDIYDKLGYSYIDRTMDELDPRLETFRQLWIKIPRADKNTKERELSIATPYNINLLSEQQTFIEEALQEKYPRRCLRRQWKDHHNSKFVQ